MEQEKVFEIKNEIEDLKRNKARVKVLIFATVVLFACDLISLLFSILTKHENVIESKEIGYFVVLAVTIAVFTVAFILFTKIEKKIEKLEDSIKKMDE